MKEIFSVTTGEKIPYEFKRITYRQFQKAIGLLEESRKAGDRAKANELSEQAFEVLVTNSEQILDEACMADVSSVIAAAIDAQQGTDQDTKKSE